MPTDDWTYTLKFWLCAFAKKKLTFANAQRPLLIREDVCGFVKRLRGFVKRLCGFVKTLYGFVKTLCAFVKAFADA